MVIGFEAPPGITDGETAVIDGLEVTLSASAGAQISASLDDDPNFDLARAVEDGRLPWSRLDDAVSRLRRLKQRFVVPYGPPDPREARAMAGAAQWSALARSIGDRGGVPV